MPIIKEVKICKGCRELPAFGDMGTGTIFQCDDCHNRFMMVSAGRRGYSQVSGMYEYFKWEQVY